jgi:hypothetical protein
MTEAQYPSRRELREAELTSAHTGQSENLNFPPLTPSQLISMGKIPKETQETAISVPQISTTGVVNPYAPLVTQTVQSAPIQAVPISAPPIQAVIVPEVFDAVISSAPVVPVYEPVLGEAEEPITAQLQLFEVSPNLNVEPQTASIIIDNFEPLDNISIAISETGELLKTGSIELPSFSTNTGEIATILDAAQVDEAISQDSISGYVSTIAPLRASGVVNTAGKIGIMPSKSARGQGAGYAVLTLSILMIAVGGLVLAAFMLGFLK